MKPLKPPFTHNPFEDLKKRFKDRLPPAPPVPPPAGRNARPERETAEAGDDERLFLESMEDVTPLGEDRRAVKKGETRPQHPPENDEDDEALLALRDLVTHGKGFVVADTPEYIEGTGYQGNLGLARRLHRGDFSIQAHLDLHGMTVEEARDTVERFLKESVDSGKRAVSIIHGRGLSSPAEPVLKNGVIEWLTSGRWRKWVIAYASARACDGGAGATYVLLRRRPYSRRPGRKSSKRTESGSDRS